MLRKIGIFGFFLFSCFCSAADTSNYYEVKASVIFNDTPEHNFETASVIMVGTPAHTVRYQPNFSRAVNFDYNIENVDQEGNITISVSVDYASEGEKWKKIHEYKATLKPGVKAKFTPLIKNITTDMTIQLNVIDEDNLVKRLGGKPIPTPKACKQKTEIFTAESVSLLSNGCCQTIDCSSNPITCCGVIFCCDGGCCCSP